MSGPTFVKFFQWASTRQDIFPKSFCARFATLQSNARTHSWRDTQRLMAASFGALCCVSAHCIADHPAGPDWEQQIHVEADGVVGSGCIAQVYRGTVQREGHAATEVAVKVIHPDVKACGVDDVMLDGLRRCRN